MLVGDYQVREEKIKMMNADEGLHEMLMGELAHILALGYLRLRSRAANSGENLAETGHSDGVTIDIVSGCSARNLPG
jgi:hypothetical protein